MEREQGFPPLLSCLYSVNGIGLLVKDVGIQYVGANKDAMR